MNAFHTVIKKCAFMAFLIGFVTVAVMNQQTFVKDLSSRAPTSEILIEANALNFIKKWNMTPAFSLDDIASIYDLESEYVDGKIYFPTQDIDAPSNICVFEHFNIPPPFIS